MVTMTIPSSTRPVRDQAQALLNLKRAIEAAGTHARTYTPKRQRLLLPPAEVNEYGLEPAVTATAHPIDILRDERALLAGLSGIEAYEMGVRAAEQARGRKPLKSAFWAFTGQPPICGPNDRRAARDFHEKVVAALERPLLWSKSERVSLYQLEARWRKRALGQDLRFCLAGANGKGGRLTRSMESRMKLLKEEKDGYA